MESRTPFYRGQAANACGRVPAQPPARVTPLRGLDGFTLCYLPVRDAGRVQKVARQLRRLGVRAEGAVRRWLRDERLAWSAPGVLAFATSLLWLVPALSALTLVAFAFNYGAPPEAFGPEHLVRTMRVVGVFVVPAVAHWHFVCGLPPARLSRRCGQLVGAWAAALLALSILARGPGGQPWSQPDTPDVDDAVVTVATAQAQRA